MTEEPVDVSAIVEPPAAAVEEQPVEEQATAQAPAVPPKAPEVRTPARPVTLAIARLVRALWLGSGAFLMLTAAAAFGAASNATDAANVVGAVLTRWHYIALFAPLLLLLLEWRRSRPAMLVLLFIAILLASSQALLDTRIRMIRLDSIVPISNLSPDDPVRRHFGFLHGMSSLFLIGQVIAAGAAVAMRDDRNL
ncbi:MAG: hypothetical protein QOC81_3841 [Thermoanaerobaculia bacterium]|jgi:hypothetical protein|nr:hypothetical protein [Thermoanaerobaculia bacterium]